MGEPTPQEVAAGMLALTNRAVRAEIEGRNLREHIRELAVELDRAATNLDKDARSAPQEKAVPAVAAAQAYWGCANRLRIILGGTDG